MAGHRHSRAAATPEGRPRPTRAQARVANLHASARRDYAGAQDEPGRFKSAARSLLAAAAALRRRDPAAADQLTRELTGQVLRAATAMTARLAELGPRPSQTKAGPSTQTANQTGNRRRTP